MLVLWSPPLEMCFYLIIRSNFVPHTHGDNHFNHTLVFFECVHVRQVFNLPPAQPYSRYFYGYRGEIVTNCRSDEQTRWRLFVLSLTALNLNLNASQCFLVQSSPLLTTRFPRVSISSEGRSENQYRPAQRCRHTAILMA